MLDEGANAFLRHGGRIAVARIHPAFFDLGDFISFLSSFDDGFVFFKTKPAAGFLCGASAAVFEFAIGLSPRAGVADAFDVFQLVWPFAVNPATVVWSESNPQHGPRFAFARIDEMEDGSLLGNFVVRDDMNILAEFWKHRHPRLGRHAVGTHQDALAVAAA